MTLDLYEIIQQFEINSHNLMKQLLVQCMIFTIILFTIIISFIPLLLLTFK